MNTILLLEDEESLRRGISFKLEKEGFSVLTCSGVQEAKKSIQSHDVQLILCDITLLSFQVRNEENQNAGQMKQEILSLAEELGIQENQVNVNSNYLLLELDPGMEIIIPGICIILIIMVVSALVIYNIFNLAAVQKIREYGRLKAIGASQKHLKHIIRMEGFLLSAAVIPCGILIGSLLLKIWMNFSLKINRPVFSLPLAIFVTLLTFATVALSMKKPVRFASKTSPVDAIRYEEGTKTAARKGYANLNIFRLTLSNLSLHKKRTITTILTMGLSCTLFVIISNVVGNMDANPQVREDIEHGRFRIEIDAPLNDNTYPENNMNAVQKQAPFDAAFQQRLREIPGVTGVWSRKQMAVRHAGQNTEEENYVTISVVNEEDFAWLKKNTEQGTVSYDNTAETNGVIYMWDHFFDDNYKLNDLYECEILDGDRTVPFSEPILGTCSHSNDSDFTITEATFETLGIQTDMTSILFVDCDPEREAEVKEKLEQIVYSMAHISMVSYQDQLAVTNLGITLLRSSCYSFLIILSLIGFMNMANTMITSIITRKREFGIMQAIGMSNRQQNQMLQIEGLIFTAGTAVISLTLGNLLGYFIFQLCKEHGFIGLFEYRLPVLELSLLTVGIILLQAALAFILSRNIKKESLVERIRHQE